MTISQPNYGNRPIDQERLTDFVVRGRDYFYKVGDYFKLRQRRVQMREPTAHDYAVARGLTVLRYAMPLMGGVALFAFSPIEAGAALVQTALLALPVSLALFALTRFDAARADRLMGRQSETQISWGFALFMATAGLMWMVNMGLDKAPASALPLTIVEKVDAVSPTGTVGYIGVDLPAQNFFRFGATTRELIKVAPLDYMIAVPQTMQVVLTLHHGFLGMPWVEKTYTLVNSRTSSGRAQGGKSQHIDNVVVSKDVFATTSQRSQPRPPSP